MTKRSRILGVGTYLPPQVYTNQDLAKMMDTSDEWIQQRTGIKQRHWADRDTGTSDLAYHASLRALEAAKSRKEEIDLIIFATLSPDYFFPGSGCLLQAKLELPGVPALDIRQQCTGFIYGMSIADQFLKTGMYKKVLVVGAEVHSKGLEKNTHGRDVAVLFGDAAGAVVMDATDLPSDPAEARNAPGILSTHLHADGKYARELLMEPGMHAGTDVWVTREMIDETREYPKMNGKAVFMHAVKRMPEAINAALEANALSVADVDLFVFHQANLRINEMVAKQLGIPEEKVFNTIDRFGNTTAATIPLGLDEAVKAGKLKPGMLVASAAFGSGFTWASALYRW